MKPFPTDPMRQHDLFVAALCADWREAGTVTRDTPRANAVMEISKAISTQTKGRGGQPNKRTASI